MNLIKCNSYCVSIIEPSSQKSDNFHVETCKSIKMDEDFKSGIYHKNAKINYFSNISSRFLTRLFFTAMCNPLIKLQW